MAKVLSAVADSQLSSMGQQHHPAAIGHMHTQLTKSLERILEEAHLSGELKLSGRKLKDFPRTGGKYDLTDTVIADLSKNKFWELPQEVLEFLFVEKLHLYHNALRSVPEGLGCLQSLRFLDLGRNQLCTLPEGLCHLQSLEVLLVANNKLGSLPDDIGNLKSLMELDASCNEITHLPRSLGRLKNLKAVDFRKNLLVELPLELTYLKLTCLDMSENRLSTLPVELRLMSSLERLRLEGNPLMCPPAVLVSRGRVHIFKFLETQAVAQERRRGGEDGRRTLRKTGLPDLRAKRHTVDSGYSTSDGMDSKWMQECLGVNERGKKKEGQIGGSGESEGGSSSSTVCSTPETSRSTLALDQLEAKRLILLQSNDRLPTKPTHSSATLPAPGTGHHSPLDRNGSDDRRPLDHIQTYREYKEALRQQRAAQPQDVYRPKGDMSPAESPTASGTVPERPVQKVPPSRVLNGDAKQVNGEPKQVNGDAKHVNGDKLSGSDYVKPASPGPPRQRQISPRPLKWASDHPPDKLSFTMRREFERAKEEAELMAQLRHNIETRLRMSLPEDLGPALMDGVVLCHLANHVRPRSVASIHVPSPAVPKLSMARCRRNVDNFLGACRKIGVEEDDLCSVEDVVASLDVAAVLRTVRRLLHPRPPPPPPSCAQPPHPKHYTIPEDQSPTATSLPDDDFVWSSVKPAATPRADSPSTFVLILIFCATCALLYFLPHEE